MMLHSLLAIYFGGTVISALILKLTKLGVGLNDGGIAIRSIFWPVLVVWLAVFILVTLLYAFIKNIKRKK